MGFRIGLLCAALACFIMPASAFVSPLLTPSTPDAVDRAGSMVGGRRTLHLRESTTALNLFGFGEKKEPEPAAPPAKAAGPCKTCNSCGAVDCNVCKGTGKDKATGNALERWKCVKCQGFGLMPCPVCAGASRGLTPEQTGER